MEIKILGHRGRGGRSGRPVDWRSVSFWPAVRSETPHSRWGFAKRLGWPSDPVEWEGGDIVRGEIKAASLNGNYDLVLKFQDTELKNWIKSYIEHNPQGALELFAEMMPLAVEKLKG